jgi:hypothetical protein
LRDKKVIIRTEAANIDNNTNVNFDDNHSGWQKACFVYAGKSAVDERMIKLGFQAVKRTK